MSAPPSREPPRSRSRGGTTVRPSRQRQLATKIGARNQPPRARSGALSPQQKSLDGYVRVSRVGGRSGEHFISPEVQEERIRAYARARGRSIGTVFRELDRSGTTFRRALVQQALQRIENGESGGLIVARLDRFARTVLEALEALGRIQRAGGEFISVEDGLDSSTPFGRAMMTILLAFAELEAGRARDVFRSAQARAVMRGIHVTGRLPLGYRRDETGRLMPIPEQAAAIRNAYLKRAFGALPGEIVEEMQASGVFVTRSEKSMIRHAKYLLRNPVYTGEARCGDFVNPLAHPAIVSRAVWLAAQDPRTQTTFSRNVRTLLAGLVRCGSCGGTMSPRRVAHGRRYQCKNRGGGCSAPAKIPCEELEARVTSSFFRWLTRLDRQAAARRLTELEAATITADAAYGREIAEPSTHGNLTSVRQASARAWRELAESARLALVLELPQAASLRQLWPSLNECERRRMLAAAISRVTVSPSSASTSRRRPDVRVAFISSHPLKQRRSARLAPSLASDDVDADPAALALNDAESRGGRLL